MTTHATLHPGTYDDVHAQVEQLARGLDYHSYLVGTWLRELAIGLALHADLVVSVVTYGDGGQELEVRMASSPNGDGVVIGRSATGDQCQISLDLWASIKDQPSREQAVRLARALLRANASVTH